MREMLNDYGLDSRRLFVVHPREAGAQSVSGRLAERCGENISIVQVEREVIARAQALDNAWDVTLKEIGTDFEWWRQLMSFDSHGSAVIVDVFNATGRTYESLHRLVEHFGITVRCYFPMVDRDFGDGAIGTYRVEKRCLYEWYGPRRQHRESAGGV